MWKAYSQSYIRKNRASSVAIMASALIAAMFLSLVYSLFYNAWTYDVESIILNEGAWQARLTGPLDADALATIRDLANVETAVVNETLSTEQATAVDLTFADPRTVYRDMPQLAQALGLNEDAVSYHALLLSRFLIHDPADPTPPLLLSFYLLVLALVSLSLVLIIHNAFAASMQARVHQLGILASVGATPRQLRACLMQEAAALCAVPVLLGSLLGVALSFGTMQAVNAFAAGVEGRRAAVFGYHPLVGVVTLLAAALTVLLSAWLPARKLRRLSPLEAIRDTGEPGLRRKKRAGLLGLLFGVEGTLAANALKARKKALRTTALSLTFSFLGFTLMLCFFTLSGISTQHTYFERYQEAWDVMATLEDTRFEDFTKIDAVRALPGVRDCVVYQKAAALSRIPEADLSAELAALGGPAALTGDAVREEAGYYVAETPLIILDDAGFAAYCAQLGVPPRPDGCIVLNRIWDSANSNFRYKIYVPYVKEDRHIVTLQGDGSEAMELPVLAYAQEPPALREEYANYALVQFIPLSLWRQTGPGLGGTEAAVYIRLLGAEDATLAELDALQSEVQTILDADHTATVENRMREKLADDEMRSGGMVLLGGFCVLLATIGLANVFAATAGFLYQRRREFARYLSVGVTPRGLWKVLWLEAAAVAGRPVLITLPLTAVFVAFAVRASYLDPAEFFAVLPARPIVAFVLAIFLCVGAAYYMGSKRLLRGDLSTALKDDALL